MKLHYYPETDSLYVELKAGPGVETREVSSGINVDLDAAGNAVGLDIDHASAGRASSIWPRSKPKPCPCGRQGRLSVLGSAPMPKRPSRKTVETLTHGDASRKNIPTAEFRSVMERAEQGPVQVAYQRRNRDLDPQLVWRGKDAQDWSDLVVQAPPLFIQEKVHPKVLVDDLRRQRGNGTGRAGR